MASINIAKNTMTAAAQLGVHFDDKKRLELNHANKDINKDLTDQNYWVGCEDYADIMDKLKNRLAEVDAVQPPKQVKADRKTVCTWEFTCPWEIVERGEDNEFFQKTYELIQQMAGSENVAGMAVHKDEVHEYMDNGELQLSRYHGHAFVTPYNAEKGVNCKSVCTRKFFKDVNKAMDDMCRHEFGIAYQTGEYARNKSVEQLKVESYRELHQEVERQGERLSACKNAADAEYDRYEELEQANIALKTLSDRLNEDIQSKQDYLSKQTETALNALYEVLEPLKKRAGEKVKPEKVILKDLGSYEQIKDLEQSMRQLVSELREFSKDLPNRQKDLEDRQGRLEILTNEYENLYKAEQSHIENRANTKAQGDYKKWVEATRKDINQGLNQMIQILDKAGHHAEVKQILEDNPYLEEFQSFYNHEDHWQ